MKRKIILIPLGIIFFIAFTLIGSISIKESKTVKYNLPKVDAIVTVTKGIQKFEIVYTPTISNSFVGFKEAVAFRESQGKYLKVNTLGYMGKYQFGKSTLRRLKIYNTRSFLNNPKQQEEAFIALCSLNKWILKRDIKRSVGKTINGILITESGILAAAHLAGAGNVKIYLRSNGINNFTDGYGTNLQSYMNKFSGYDTSFIKPIKNATI
ncbi:MAG: peptidoglycan-binding protein LysM [Flavobacteriaceae bacterium]|nr:peptidoglycan-binding protein LysM [Flavobacteriaceae bacterium]